MTLSITPSEDLTTHPSGSSAPNTRDYTLILYGATSFVGQITAHYLSEFLQAQPIHWAIAGRNKDKLEKLKQALMGNTAKGNNNAINDSTDDSTDDSAHGSAHKGDMAMPNLPEIIIADSEDDESLEAMCQRGQVIISTVGPYLKYGEPLIKACVQTGTDYVDLTGETIFIKDMMDNYQAEAQRSGARIVNSCGFDSIPSDLGVYFTQQQAKLRYDAPCAKIEMRVKSAKGGLSGGTIASMATIFAEAGQDQARRQQLADPYLLNDDPQAPQVRQVTHSVPSYDETHERWLAPFIMDSINTRIVHRSNQLLDYAYGRDFKYDEAMWMPSGLKGRAMSYALTAGIGSFALTMSFAKSRELISEHILPKSGDGPSKKEQNEGHFDLRFFATTAKGQRINSKVTGNRDPGYGSTSRMLAQAALCLAQDTDKRDIGGGFWTPAAAMGDALTDRLCRYGVLNFSLTDDC